MYPAGFFCIFYLLVYLLSCRHIKKFQFYFIYFTQLDIYIIFGQI